MASSSANPAGACKTTPFPLFSVKSCSPSHASSASPPRLSLDLLGILSGLDAALGTANALRVVLSDRLRVMLSFACSCSAPSGSSRE